MNTSIVRIIPSMKKELLSFCVRVCISLNYFLSPKITTKRTYSPQYILHFCYTFCLTLCSLITYEKLSSFSALLVNYFYWPRLNNNDRETIFCAIKSYANILIYKIWTRNHSVSSVKRLLLLI